MKHQEYQLTPNDIAILNKVTEVIATPLSVIATQFMQSCERDGIQRKVAVQAYSVYIMGNLARMMAQAAGVPPHEIDMKQLTEFAWSASRSLASDTSEWILSLNNDIASSN